MRLSSQLLAVALLGTIGAATAQEVVFDRASTLEASRSRAEVRAETRSAVAAGQIPRGEATPDPVLRTVSNRTRSELRAETLDAIAAGRILHGEAGATVAEPFVAVKTRAEVRAETREAMRFGLIPHGEAPIRIATPAQREAIRVAGLRAREAANALAAR